jgi:hypothetical protein
MPRPPLSPSSRCAASRQGANQEHASVWSRDHLLQDSFIGENYRLKEWFDDCIVDSNDRLDVWVGHFVVFGFVVFDLVFELVFNRTTSHTKSTPCKVIIIGFLNVKNPMLEIVYAM